MPTRFRHEEDAPLRRHQLAEETEAVAEPNEVRTGALTFFSTPRMDLLAGVVLGAIPLILSMLVQVALYTGQLERIRPLLWSGYAGMVILLAVVALFFTVFRPYSALRKGIAGICGPYLLVAAARTLLGHLALLRMSYAGVTPQWFVYEVAYLALGVAMLRAAFPLRTGEERR